MSFFSCLNIYQPHQEQAKAVPQRVGLLISAVIGTNCPGPAPTPRPRSRAGAVGSPADGAAAGGGLCSPCESAAP